jgi:hypothetical protein
LARSDLHDVRERFLEEQFGEPDLVLHPVISEFPHVDVNVYPPATTGRPYVTLVTNGLSDFLLEYEYEAPDWNCDRAELVMYLADLELSRFQTEFPWQVNLLRRLARLPSQTDFRPAAFMALPNGTPPEPYSRPSELTHAVLLPPWHEPAEFRDGFDGPDGTSVEFLWLDLMTSAEAAFLEQRGPGPFLSLLQSAGHEPPTRSLRPCYARAEKDLLVVSDYDDNRVRQLETRVYEGDDGPVHLVKVGIDVADAGAADLFVARLVRQVALQRSCSPPQTTALVVTIVGELTAPAFAALWWKHLMDSTAMSFFMSKMTHASVIQGTRTGEVLSECSLLEPDGGRG